MIINISKADAMKGQTIKPGWYKAEVIDFTAKTSKDGQSMNYTPILQLETPNQEVIDNHNFNSKAIGMMTPYLAAINNKTLKEYIDTINGAVQTDTDTHKGKKLQVKVKNEVWEGRLLNRIEGFLPYDEAPPF